MAATYMIKIAAEHGHLEFLKYLDVNCMWPNKHKFHYICAGAAKAGKSECLEYLRSVGYEWIEINK